MRVALITLWEAADRICGKRLKALIPTLIESMTRHSHLSLSKGVHQRLKQISAATIDRLLHDVREQAFSGQRRRASGVGSAIRRALPFPLRGLDCDNDTAFMNETVFDFCKVPGIELTRSRAYKKNDQAWVEQKNGAIVRRLVGYGRLQSLEATEILASLYQVSRLFINFFQPSFKLKSKTRHGAKVTKHYESPLTPLERVLRSASVPEATKRKLRTRFRALDPLDLLSRMREAQQHVATCSECGPPPAGTETPDRVALAEFLVSLGTAWQDGEVRPTHQRKAGVPHTWRSRQDPFEHTWPTIQQWLESEPGITARKLHERLVALAPAMYSSAQLRTLQRRVKAWRSNRARELVTRILGDADAMKAGAATQRQPSSQNNRKTTIRLG